MNRDTELTLGRADSAVPPRRGLVGGQWLGAVVVVLAFAADLLVVGFFDSVLVTRFGQENVPRLVAVAVVVVMAGTLLWRRRAPLPVLILVLAMSVGISLWWHSAQPFFCLLVAVYAAARHAGRRVAILVLGLGLAGVLTTTALVFGDGQEGSESLNVWGFAFPALILSIATLSVWSLARRELASSRRAAALADQMSQHAEQATQAERERIARELHDILAHSVSAMMMQAAGARALAQTVSRDEPQDPRVHSIQEALSTIETTGSQSMRELHRLLGTSMSSGLDLDASGPSEPPSLANVEDLVATGRHSGLIVEVHRSGPPGELDPSVGIAAYRTVQESLTNALKHLGSGTVVDIYESWSDEQLQVQVRCRGGHAEVMVDAPNGGHGLRGLRERVELAGGSFESGWVGDEYVTTAVLPQSGTSSGARGHA